MALEKSQVAVHAEFDVTFTLTVPPSVFKVAVVGLIEMVGSSFVQATKVRRAIAKMDNFFIKMSVKWFKIKFVRKIIKKIGNHTDDARFSQYQKNTRQT